MYFKVFILFYLFSTSFINSIRSEIKKEDFKGEIEGKKVHLFILTNKKGHEVTLTNYGGAIAAIMVPDKKGHLENVVQGHDSLENYLNSPKKHLSTLVGRFANRIKDGKFMIDNEVYQLEQNNKNNHIHGGTNGFNTKVWDAVQMSFSEVKMYYTSVNGEEGYPGKLYMEVTFTFNDEDELIIKYSGHTTKKTIVNMTHHLFVNLDGIKDPCSSIEDHLLTLNSKLYLPTDENQIPTGEIKKVDNTPFDFLTKRTIGERINDYNDPQIKIGDGYDHCFVLDKKTNGELSFAGKLYSPNSGRTMEVYTTEPGLQVYTANSHDGFKGYHGIRMPRRSAIALEAQHFPNSPNVGFFPTVLLKPGETYNQTTIYKFGVEK